jgi:hypothetical protein
VQAQGRRFRLVEVSVAQNSCAASLLSRTHQPVELPPDGCGYSFPRRPPSLDQQDHEGACKSMNHAQKQLAQANRQIAELTVQIVRHRAIVKHALDSGQRSEMAESLLDALEGSLRLFEKHRIFLLSCSVNGYAGHPAPRLARGLEPAAACHDATGVERYDEAILAKKQTIDSLIGSGCIPPTPSPGRGLPRVGISRSPVRRAGLFSTPKGR